MTLREKLVYSSIEAFFKKTENINIILPIISGNDTISLRLLDWYVTNFTKKQSTQYYRNGKQFIVFLDYKAQLKSFSKKLFDPFCRRSRINFNYGASKHFCTTVGQLNFFKWAIENKVIDNLHNCIEEVEANMNSIGVVKEKSCSGIKKIKKHEVVIVLTFT